MKTTTPRCQPSFPAKWHLVATGNVVAAAIIARNPPKKPVTKFLIKDSPCFIGLNKGETKLAEKVNAIIAAAKVNGELNKIAMKWLGAGLAGRVLTICRVGKA